MKHLYGLFLDGRLILEGSRLCHNQCFWLPLLIAILLFLCGIFYSSNKNTGTSDASESPPMERSHSQFAASPTRSRRHAVAASFVF
jgi:hypothetical protein